jgi:hypothetical protein
MNDYAVTIKYVHKRAGESIEDAIKRELQELPDDALVLEANAFPSRVANNGGRKNSDDSDSG